MDKERNWCGLVSKEAKKRGYYSDSGGPIAARDGGKIGATAVAACLRAHIFHHDAAAVAVFVVVVLPMDSTRVSQAGAW